MLISLSSLFTLSMKKQAMAGSSSYRASLTSDGTKIDLERIPLRRQFHETPPSVVVHVIPSAASTVPA
jgi:hypothetical protein